MTHEQELTLAAQLLAPMLRPGMTESQVEDAVTVALMAFAELERRLP